MKKHLKTIAIALISTMAVATGYANETKPTEPASFNVGMYFDKHSGNIKTFIEKQAGKFLLISFQDEHGNELESTIVGKKREKGMIAFNVKELPNGTYQMKISSGKEQSVHVLDIQRPTPDQTVSFR